MLQSWKGDAFLIKVYGYLVVCLAFVTIELDYTYLKQEKKTFFLIKKNVSNYDYF